MFEPTFEPYGNNLRKTGIAGRLDPGKLAGKGRPEKVEELLNADREKQIRAVCGQ